MRPSRCFWGLIGLLACGGGSVLNETPPAGRDGGSAGASTPFGAGATGTPSPEAGSAGKTSASAGAAGASPSSGGAGGAPLTGGSPGTIDSGKEPPLAPKLLVSTVVGGTGNQYIRSVEFGADGTIVAKGKGFSVTYDAEASHGMITGEAAANDTDSYRGGNKLDNIGNKISDPRNGQTYEIGYSQAGKLLQQPFLKSSAGWKFWGWSDQDVGSLTADSRGYDVWLMPNDLIAIVAWTAGGNSTLTKDPQDLTKPLDAVTGALQSGPGHTATLWMLVDPKQGRPLSGTFLNTQAMTRAADAYGRLYIPTTIGNGVPVTNPFDQDSDAGAGLFVLRPDLKQAELNVLLGSSCMSGMTNLSAIAIRNNVLVMGGTHCSQTTFKATSNAVQSKPGGDQDGYLVVIKLWQ